MSVKIKFDKANNPEELTMILAKRNGDVLGQLNTSNVEVSTELNNPNEISFIVKKYDNGKLSNLWEDIINFKLIHCLEWDMWFEIKVEKNENSFENEDVTKTVYCKQLGQAELSQTNLYNIEINTELDISREDYKLPTVFYDEDNTESSLLHRVLEKVPNYKIGYVSPTLKNIQRTFSFDGISIYDCLNKIGEEIDCLFIYPSNTDSNGKINRIIEVYDMKHFCNSCKQRIDNYNICEKCGSTDITNGYGDDTNIFITSEELTGGNEIQFTSNVDNVKNCFKLVAGDDLMSATVMNCNPNGSDYIWKITDSCKTDMSDDLVKKLDEYDNEYKEKQLKHNYSIDNNKVANYNKLVELYKVRKPSLEKLNESINGYSNLMSAYYNTIDLNIFLEHEMMPNAELDDTNAKKEAELLNSTNLSPVALPQKMIYTDNNLEQAILNYAKSIVDNRYKISFAKPIVVKDRGQPTCTVTCQFDLVRYSDDKDTAKSLDVTIDIKGDYLIFIKQKIQKVLKKNDEKNNSIVDLFKLEDEDFKKELKKYNITSLKNFGNCCQGCIDVLVDKGITDVKGWKDKENDGKNPYYEIYIPYTKKQILISEAITERQNQIDIISGKNGIQKDILKLKDDTQQALNIKNYLGDELWKELCCFRREDTFSNENFISTNLNNAEVFNRALEFLSIANNEINKSSIVQHGISTTLANLLTIEKFKPLVDNFKVGNWVRIMVDGKVYRLRLIKYVISYDDLSNISVEFTDVQPNMYSNIETIKDVLNKANSMSTSYGYVKRQAEQGKKGSEIISNWREHGLDLTNAKIVSDKENQSQVWDKNGLLLRSFDDIKQEYNPQQMKILNSSILMTDDNWKTTKSAIGIIYYQDLKTNEYKMAYGINAEVLVGKLLLGENIELTNKNNNLAFNDKGLRVSNGTNSFNVNPNSDVLLSISNSDDDVFYIDKQGKLHISADGSNIDVSANSDITNLKSKYDKLNNSLDNLTRDNQDYKQKITDITNTNKSDISSLSSNISSLNTNIDNIKLGMSNTISDISNINKSLSNVISENEKLKKENNSLKSDFKKLDDRLKLLEAENKNKEGGR